MWSTNIISYEMCITDALGVLTPIIATVYHWCIECTNPGPLATKRMDVLPQYLVKTQSRSIGC